MLTVARALENVGFLVAVDQTGEFFTRHSLVASPMGRVVVELGEEERGSRSRLLRGQGGWGEDTNRQVAEA